MRKLLVLVAMLLCTLSVVAFDGDYRADDLVEVQATLVEYASTYGVPDEIFDRVYFGDVRFDISGARWLFDEQGLMRCETTGFGVPGVEEVCRACLSENFGSVQWQGPYLGGAYIVTTSFPGEFDSALVVHWNEGFADFWRCHLSEDLKSCDLTRSYFKWRLQPETMTKYCQGPRASSGRFGRR